MCSRAGVSNRQALITFLCQTNSEIKNTLIPRIGVFCRRRSDHFFQLRRVSSGDVPRLEPISHPYVGKGSLKGPTSRPSVILTYSPSFPGTHPFTYTRFRLGSILYTYAQRRDTRQRASSGQCSSCSPCDRASSSP